MIVCGSFPTTTPVEALRALSTSPELLEQVSTLSGVEAGPDGVLHTVFTPSISLGRIPLRTTITTLSADDRGAQLRVVGRRGVQGVDVLLDLTFTPVDAGIEVSWSADVVVRGNAASVGQRVARDLATRAIGKVLAEAAQVAGAPAGVAR